MSSLNRGLNPLPGSNRHFEGNWYPFPPPEHGFYDLRQAVRGPVDDPQQYFFLFLNKRVYEGSQRRLLVMGKRVSRMGPDKGWQFRFRQEVKNGVKICYRPFAVIYDIQIAEGPATAGIMPVPIRKDDVSQQLPIAVSREEALYIVRAMPDRWPIFRKIHIEYTPEAVT